MLNRRISVAFFLVGMLMHAKTAWSASCGANPLVWQAPMAFREENIGIAIGRLEVLEPGIDVDALNRVCAATPYPEICQPQELKYLFSGQLLMNRQRDFLFEAPVTVRHKCPSSDCAGFPSSGYSIKNTVRMIWKTDAGFRISTSYCDTPMELVYRYRRLQRTFESCVLKGKCGLDALQVFCDVESLFQHRSCALVDARRKK